MRISVILLSIVLIGTLTACNQQSTATPVSDLLGSPTSSAELTPTDVPQPTATQPVAPPPRVLSVCLGQEPSSLFLYGDTTSAAQSIRQAIYDGPFDIFNYELVPVILQRMPSIENGDALIKPVEVIPGTLIIDSNGDWVALDEGVIYRPSGCTSPDCAMSYTGDEPVLLDELAVQFRLLPEIEWSDGVPLTAHDSVYAFQVLKELYSGVPSELSRYTRSYQALDDLTVEWVGIPGYQGVYQKHFLTPFPQHLWGLMAPEELLVSELSTRMPLGWGAYVIDEWVAGDHISLRRNTNYFRNAEGLPYFDFLVFRFTETPDAAIDALLAGECDFVDRSAALETQLSRVLDLERNGNLRAAIQSGTAWEHLSFGVTSIDPERPKFFASKEVRQAVAMCIDRQAIASALFSDEALVPDTFVPVTHPMKNMDIIPILYDPQKASEMLGFAGWIDHDADPATARISAGVAGVTDGTPFEIEYLAPMDAERPEVSQVIVDSLAKCGIKADINQQEWAALLGPGPEAPIFGRQFDLAQFAWAYSIHPTCSLFSSEEIPGPYPEYPKSWTGANATGYQNIEYDRVCTQTMRSLPDSDEYQTAQFQTQSIFADDLPALPLYQRFKLAGMRADMCNVNVDPAFGSALSAIEVLNYGADCE